MDLQIYKAKVAGLVEEVEAIDKELKRLADERALCVAEHKRATAAGDTAAVSKNGDYWRGVSAAQQKNGERRNALADELEKLHTEAQAEIGREIIDLLGGGS